MAEPVHLDLVSQETKAVMLGATVFVRGLKVDAEIGLYEHEHGRKQPLLIDVEMTLEPGDYGRLSGTVNYEMVVNHAQDIVAAGHVTLVEVFAERLARACLQDARVHDVRVRIEKPEALAPHAQAGGVELVMGRS